MKITTKILVACLPAIVTGALFAATTGQPAVSKPNAAATSKAHDALDKLSLSFEPNRGQTDPRVQFLSRGQGYTVYFTKDEMVMSLKGAKTSDAVVRMKFVGGTQSASVQPLDALPNVTNYMIGQDSSKWLTDVPEYAKIRYENVYPGIDVLYQGDNKQLRYDFIVKPGADATAIQMAFTGADNISVNSDGNLALTIGGRTLITKKPFTYQEEGGSRKEIASNFVVKDGRVTFQLAKYDTSKNLVIDPSVVFATYLGGALVDIINGVSFVNPILTQTSSSALFLTGTTSSLAFPGAATGQFQSALVGAQNVFVTKLSFTGQLVWSTYLGGNSRDHGNAIAVDTSNTSNANCSSGCPIVVGQTFSVNFPTMPFQTPPLSGTNDAFAAKLSADGKTLIYSSFLGGLNDDQATGVVVNAVSGDAYVGGFTASATFLGQQNAGTTPNCPNCTNSSDAFVVKIPVTYPTTPFNSVKAVLYGGFGEEFARGIAYNPDNNMVYLGGDTTTGAQNFISPNNVNLPGISNNTAAQYTGVPAANGGTTTSGLPGPFPNARGGFVVAFEGVNLNRTYATYVANDPIGSNNFESITGIAAEGGCGADTTPSTTNGLKNPPYMTCIGGNIGHVYITGVTTSKVASAGIAKVVPGVGCSSAIIASSLVINAGVQIIGPAGIPITTQGGQTLPAGCVTALITQAPFNTNQAVTTGCQFPFPLLSDQVFTPTATCNLAAYVGIIDGALLTAPGANPAPVGNQIEYWAYYSSSNANTVANAIAIDTNRTASSFFASSIGTYQQMYITGSTQQTVNSGATCLSGGAAAYTQIANCLPMTNIIANPAGSTYLNPSEIFTSYNVGVTTGGGVGGFTPYDSNYTVPQPCPTPAANGCAVNAYVARFNANGVVASSYGGQGSAFQAIPNMGYGTNETPEPPVQQPSGLACPAGGPCDHSFLIHTPQFNFGEYVFGEMASDGSSTPNTIGHAIAVDPTRATLVGGETNVSNSPAGKSCTPAIACNFATTNGAQQVNNGGIDGWAAVLFFNDIVTDAASVTTANPWLLPNAAQQITQGANGSYIQTTPAPFGPTFDFAISDPSTQTQTIHVGFTGNPPVIPAWFVPTDPRGGANPPVFDNNLPGSGIAYYLPCNGPGNNAYPAPGGAYGPMTCAFPTNHLYEALPMLFSGWPGLTPAQANGTLVTPGWLIVSQDQTNSSVRLQLDRRAAAGLLEGTYVAQFLITTLDSQAGAAGHPNQWPPCGPLSALNPYAVPAVLPPAGLPCTTNTTPLPADNVSVLVTVRLIVRPTLFLSRNAGILTGVTSSLAANPLYGPTLAITTQTGTSKVPDWWFTGATNDIDAWPAGAPAGLASIFTSGNNGVNSNSPTCVSAAVAGTTVANFIGTIAPNLGDPANPHATAAGQVTVPCPVSATAPAVVGTTFGYGAAAYLGNGPGDLSGGAIVAGAGPAPVMTFLYDVGTVLAITPGPVTACSKFAGDPTNSATANECNLSIEQNLAPSRPDQPTGVTTFNADWQGGQDPLPQRNDATVHDYYVTAEGGATISVAAVNCTGWGLNGVHNTTIGNWLAVKIGGGSSWNPSVANGNAIGNPDPAIYQPICTDLTPATVGTLAAPVTGCPQNGCTFKTTGVLGASIGDDAANPGAPGGQQIPLDFIAKAFTGGCNNNVAVPNPATGLTTCTTVAGVGPRVAFNGVPTGFYTAQVYVWSTRAKNVEPGYCLGASSPATLASGLDPVPECKTTTAAGSSGNPNPQVPVTGLQTFTVRLFVFDTTQIIQITPNGCPTNGIQPGQTVPLTSTVANPENLFTGNITPPYGPSSTVNYANFPQNQQDNVVWSLTPWGPFTPGLTSCTLPPGGQTIAGLGTINNVGPTSETSFTAAPQILPGVGPTGPITFYACRPTVAPAFLAQPNWQEDPVKFPPYPAAFLAASEPVPSLASQTCTINGGGSAGQPISMAANATKVGIIRGLPGNAGLAPTFNFDSNGNGLGPVPADPGDRQDFFLPPDGGKAGDVGIVGDWSGAGHAAAGWFRPSTAEFWLDTNNDGTYAAGVDAHYTYGFPGAGDVPVVGDWTGSGHANIGVVHQGFLWILDLNGDGVFQQPLCQPSGNLPGVPGCKATDTSIAGDAVFAFQGSPSAVPDIPVVGNWSQVTSSAGYPVSQAGVVRSPSSGGGPFLWLLDSAVPGTPTNVTPQSTHGLIVGGVGFGGMPGDVPVTGDWYGDGIVRFGQFRGGFLWVLDSAPPLAAQINHTVPGFVFAYGGLKVGGVLVDSPVVGKW